ncbi:MAG: cadmium-translocating P-type ATPase [Deltaproteobacteria bacterium CG11_big_fil_rev_8_21_14_0_20_47_16]|nr:MAG: cadmium-translocating P-type ATPase [Deltaproteobacteria bacterium CG11_big_fil_rev_8_21_14_0_20_47_16]
MKILNYWPELTRITLLGLILTLVWLKIIPNSILLPAIAIGIYPILKESLIELWKYRRVTTELFITMATAVAVVGGEYLAASVILVLILIAELVEEISSERARRSIRALIGSVPKIAWVRRDGGEVQVPVESLKAGDIVLVRNGEQIPVDGQVVKGDAAVNQATITGESLPVDKTIGDRVFAGTILESSALDIVAERVGANTMYARIIALVEEADGRKAKIQRLADKVTAWLIPIVFIFILGVYLYTHDLRLIITLLIFTSPAEIGLATPLVVISAIARAAHMGILVKGGIYLEQLSKATVIVFDKTGTLTFGEPKLMSVESLVDDVSRDQLLLWAGGAERRSNHPFAKALLRYLREHQQALLEPSSFEVLPGGVRATVDQHVISIGNAVFAEKQGVAAAHLVPCEDATTLYVMCDSRLVGRLCYQDMLREGGRAALADLQEHGIRIMMLTGDNLKTARHVADQLGINEVRADLTPEDKLIIIRKLQSEGEVVAMVGDGVNDAPALAQADVGIAMGVMGTESAIEAADVALMTDNLANIHVAFHIGRRAYRTIKENIFFGVGVVHVAGITLALLGIIGPIEAAVLHFFPDLFVFLNSIKMLRMSEKKILGLPS